MKPVVSVVMAAKNYAKFLPQAVDSVLAQTFADWELVIIDDGSTDDTPLTVKPYLRDPRIHYHRSDKLGQSRAKNLGFMMSRGEYIAYLDADDAWLPTKLEKQLELFQVTGERRGVSSTCDRLSTSGLRLDARSPVGVVYCARDFLDEAGNVTQAPESASAAFRRGHVLEPLFLKNFVCFSSVMIRREVLEFVGAFDPNIDLAIDYDLWMRVARHYEFDYVDERLVLYRTGHGNLSKKLTDRVDTAMTIMNKAVFRRGLQNELPRETVAEGYVSTLNTLGYVMRPSEPLTALKLYFQALLWPSSRKQSFKGIVASLLRWLSGKRSVGTPDNATINR